MFTLIACIFYVYYGHSVCAITLNASSERLTVGADFIFTCHPDTIPDALAFTSNGKPVCTMFRNDVGSCSFASCNEKLNYTCNPTTLVYTLTIPGSLRNDSYHNSKWICQDISGGRPSNEVQLFINVPISEVSIEPSSADVAIGHTQTFTCTTHPGRPTARIQWYLSDGTTKSNLTSLASQDPECYPECSQIVPSKSTVVYSGNIDDHHKIIYCIASNFEGKLAKSENSSIDILYAPNEVNISPSDKSYTVNEGGRIEEITCSADCRPNCTMAWSGPNIAVSSHVLYLQNIDRNQAGDYWCHASNTIGSIVSSIINIIVHYGPLEVNFYPIKNSYTITEGESIGSITCKADCRPNCTITWSGPNLHGGAAAVLNLHNINRNQTGDYLCRASNAIGSPKLGIIDVTVMYGPNHVAILPLTHSYKPIEKTGSVGPIYCTADCRPACVIKWNGPSLPSAVTSELTLQTVDRNQTGNYSCTAKNSVGIDVSSVISIIVQYHPTILSIQGNTIYTENNTAEFRCHVDSFPKSFIQWTFIDGKNNHFISKDNKSFYIVNGSVLKVYSMSCLSMGSYSCAADNGIGTTQKSFNVTVMCSPRLNTIEYEILDRITVGENESLNITVPILAYPSPWLYWQFQKNQYYMNITNEVTNRHYINRHESSLFIDNMEEENIGTYVIYGRNGIDDANQIGSFHVVIARRPDLPTSVVAVCKSSLLITLWRSGFDGGDKQIFTVELTNSATGDKIVSDKILDPGYEKLVKFSCDELTVDSNYGVIIKSTNNYGQSTSTTNVTCTYTGKPPSTADSSSSPSFPFGFGTGFGSAVIIFIVIVVIKAFVRIKRKRNSQPASSNMYEETGCKSDWKRRTNYAA